MSTTLPATDGQFDTGAVAVAAAKVLVLELSVPPMVGSFPFAGYLALFGLVGAGAALTHLYAYVVDPVTGTEQQLKSDTDFNTKDEVCPFAGAGATPNPHTTAAGGAFVLMLQRLNAVTRVRVYAGTAGATTVRLTGNVR